MASAEKIYDFIEAEQACMGNEEAFLEEHPYPFLVQEKTKARVPMPAADGMTRRLKSSAIAPAGDGFAEGDVWIHRVFPRDPENSAGAVTVGRDSGNDIVVEDGSISGVHAHFTLEYDVDEEKMFFLADQGSANGTFVNGDRAEGKVELSDMDSLRFGPVLKFQFFTAPAFFQFVSMYRRIKRPK